MTLKTHNGKLQAWSLFYKVLCFSLCYASLCSHMKWRFGDGRVSFISLMSCMSFSILSFSYGLCDVGLMLYSWLKVETWGMFLMEGNKFMCLESCYMSCESCNVKEMNEQVKTMYVSSLRKGKGKRPMRSNRRKHGVIWTFLLDSQPLVWIYFIAFEVWGFQFLLSYHDKIGKLSLNVGRLCPIFSKNVQQIAAPCWL